MSNISTGFASIKLLMQTLFPESSGYIQLSNPYDVEENTTASLELGWGIALNSGDNLNIALGCKISLQRNIEIVLTRRRFANELDTENKESAELSLFEDQLTLVSAIETSPALDSSVSMIAGITFVADKGIETVLDGNDAYIKLVSEFNLKYFETL